MLMIRTRFESLQCQRNKGDGRRDAGHGFVAGAGSSEKTGNLCTPRGARCRGGWGKDGRGGPSRVGNGRQKDGEEEDGQTTNSNAGDGNVDGAKEGDAKCNRCGEVGHKTVRCRRYACGACTGKGHSAKICVNVVTFFSCEAGADGSDGDRGHSGEEQDAFVCDAPGKFFNGPGKSGLAWQIGDLPFIGDNGASCHMSSSSTGMINLL